MTVPVEMAEECTESLAYPAALQTAIVSLTFKLQKLNSYVYHDSPFITPSHTLFYRTTPCLVPKIYLSIHCIL